MSRITASTDLDKVSQDDLPRYLTLFAQDVAKQFSNGIDFQTNFNCKLISITFSGAATNTSINHGLGRVPAGYLVYGQSASMAVYDGSIENTSTTLTLRSSAAGTARLIVF